MKYRTVLNAYPHFAKFGERHCKDCKEDCEFPSLEMLDCILKKLNRLEDKQRWCERMKTGIEIYEEILEYSDSEGNHNLNDVKFIPQCDLEFKIKKINNGLHRYESDVYLAKKHLLDYIDSWLSDIIEMYELDIER